MKMLFLYADDAYFWRNRLGLAREVRNLGIEVVLMTPVSNFRFEIEREGIHVIPWNLSRRSINPLRELRSFLQVLRVYRHERPDFVQHETLKAIAHGGIVARLLDHIPSVNVICGLGSIFTRSTVLMRLLRAIMLRTFPFVFGNRSCRVVCMNDGNRELLVRNAVVRPEQVSVIPGVGVCTEKFSEQPEPTGVPIVLLPSRMLWEKGVAEFAAAAKELREQGISARFVLAGPLDLDNPGFVSEAQLREWERTGSVEWWGHCNDMPSVYAKSAIVCLPSSYGEGLPNVLTEAGACGRAVIASDVPGCREVVRHEANGLLVPPRDPAALGAAIRKLLDDSALRRRFGSTGRQRAVREFSSATIIASTLDLYSVVLGRKWPEQASKADASTGRERVFSRV